MNKIKIAISLLSILLNIPYGWALSGTINKSNTPLYKQNNSSEVIGILQTGMSVKVEKRKGDFLFVSHGWVRGWVKIDDLVIHPPEFSNIENKLILSQNIIKEKGSYYLIYFFKDSIYKMDLKTQKKFRVVKVGAINQIYPSCYGEVLLVEGLYTNQQDIYNFKLVHLKNGKVFEIGSFDYSKSLLYEVNFSPDDRFMVLSFKQGDQKSISVYSTDHGELIAYALDVQGISWVDSTLIMNNLQYFWAYDFNQKPKYPDIGFNPKLLLTKIPPHWVVEGIVDSRVFDGKIYIMTKKGVEALDLATLKVTNTHFQSLLFDDSLRYNYYILNNGSGQLKDVIEDKVYSEFNGNNPKYKFEQFIGSNILYQQSIQKIDTLFLYNPQLNYLYKYKIISQVIAYHSDGIMAESFDENKGIFIIGVENPLEDRFFFVLLKEKD